MFFLKHFTVTEQAHDFQYRQSMTNCCHYDFAGLVENLENLVFGPRATDSAIKSGKPGVSKDNVNVWEDNVNPCKNLTVRVGIIR